MRDAFVRGLTALAEQDERVILLTGDLGFKIFDDFDRRFPPGNCSGRRWRLQLRAEWPNAPHTRGYWGDAHPAEHDGRLSGRSG